MENFKCDSALLEILCECFFKIYFVLFVYAYSHVDLKAH